MFYHSIVLKLHSCNSIQVRGAALHMTLTLTLHRTVIGCFIFLWVRMSRGNLLFWRPSLTADLPHLLKYGSIVKLLLRAYGCQNYCSTTFPRLFNLIVLLLAQDKMENPCSGGLSELSTHAQEYGISLQIPSLHSRYDPINVRIYCLLRSPPSTSINDKDFK